MLYISSLRDSPRHLSEGNLVYSFKSLASESFPDGYSTGGCVCPPAHRRSEPTRWFSQMTPDEHPRRHHLADGPLSSLYAPSPSLSSFGAASVMMCCSARPAFSSAPSVLPEDRIDRNIIYLRQFCDYINALHIFDQTFIVSKFCWRSIRRARLMFFPPPLSPSHPPTPPPSRWPALTTLSLIAKFNLVLAPLV